MIRQFFESLPKWARRGSIRPLQYWYLSIWAPSMRLDSDIAPAEWLEHLTRHFHTEEK